MTINVFEQQYFWAAGKPAVKIEGLRTKLFLQANGQTGNPAVKREGLRTELFLQANQQTGNSAVKREAIGTQLFLQANRQTGMPDCLFAGLPAAIIEF